LFFQISFGLAGILATILFLGGVNVLAIGITGGYVGKIYFVTKHRPIRLVKENNV